MIQVLLSIIMVFLSVVIMNGQTMKVQGSNLYDSNGQKVVLRGINYMFLEENGLVVNSKQQVWKKFIDQAAGTGANSIRIPWMSPNYLPVYWRYTYPSNGTPQTMLDEGHLSQMIAYAKSKGMYTVLELHDYTCKEIDYNDAVNRLKAFWTQASMLKTIQENKEHLIINIANEYGKVRLGTSATNTQSKKLATFNSTYQDLIKTIRTAGVDVPIMIDAPDCGMSSTELLSISNDLLNADSKKNLIFSAHSYWSGYASTTAAVNKKLDEIKSSGVCFVFGEISNRQDGATQINLDNIYKQILTRSCDDEYGWMVWAFNHDWDPDREMSPTSNINNLTTFGKDIMYNEVYGLVNGKCGNTLSSIQVNKEVIKVSPNPAKNFVSVTSIDNIQKVIIIDVAGRKVKEVDSNFNNIVISDLSKGMYLLLVQTTEEQQVVKLSVQ